MNGLKIKDVEKDDAGSYICMATNGFGSVNVNYTLIVIGECTDKVIFFDTGHYLVYILLLTCMIP